MGKQLRGNQQQKQKTILYICGVHCPFHRIQVNRALFYGLTKYTIITLNAAHTLHSLSVSTCFYLPFFRAYAFMHFGKLWFLAVCYCWNCTWSVCLRKNVLYSNMYGKRNVCCKVQQLHMWSTKLSRLVDEAIENGTNKQKIKPFRFFMWALEAYATPPRIIMEMMKMRIRKWRRSSSKLTIYGCVVFESLISESERFCNQKPLISFDHHLYF